MSNSSLGRELPAQEPLYYAYSAPAAPLSELLSGTPNANIIAAVVLHATSPNPNAVVDENNRNWQNDLALKERVTKRQERIGIRTSFRQISRSSTLEITSGLQLSHSALRSPAQKAITPMQDITAQCASEKNEYDRALEIALRQHQREQDAEKAKERIYYELGVQELRKAIELRKINQVASKQPIHPMSQSIRATGTLFQAQPARASIAQAQTNVTEPNEEKKKPVRCCNIM